MKLVDAYRLASGNLRRTKLRTFLTTAGVVVSIGSIVLLVSLGVGLQRLSVSRIASINALTRLTVMPKEGSKQKLDKDLINKLTQAPNVQFVSPELQYPSRVTFFDTQSDIMAVGIKKEYLEFADIDIAKGSNFTSDNANEALVSKAVLKLFGKENDPEGIIGKDMDFYILMTGGDKQIRERRLKAKIVGTTSDEAMSNVYLPLGLLETSEMTGYSSLSIKIKERVYVKQIKTMVEQLDLQTTAISDLIDQIDQAFFYFQLILGAIGGIALFVAAIGIVNTMTIALLERTHEIGIMKAVGARDKDIRRVFTYEAAIIGFTGGLMGVTAGWLFGVLVNWIVAELMKMNGQNEKIVLFIMPVSFAAFILLLSTLLALTAGIYPARRAAKLSPLQALRYQ